MNAEIPDLIQRMARENPTWGAPRIHGELRQLGLEVSERTVSRYLIRFRRCDGAGQRWRAFLRNHRHAITAIDFFTVPTAQFRVLYGFFVIEHGRRRILHCNVTAHPTGEWVVQQLRAAFPDSSHYRYVIMDRDSKFGGNVQEFLKATGLTPIRTSFRSPWQNGVAERWVGNLRQELLDHVIVFSEKHLRRLIRDYLDYYHEDRTHSGLCKETPKRRPVQRKPSSDASIDALTRVGGLHHRYVWRDAA